MSKRIAIITARGGSKRIPKKNIREFLGKPIIAYSIESAVKSRMFDEIMVSTDSYEIAEVAKKYGANVPFLRSAKTSDDYATTSDVLMEVLNMYGEKKMVFDTMVCIYPTAPFITGEQLKKAVLLLEENKVSEVEPVISFSYPPQRGFVLRDERLVMKEPEYRNTRSQDLEIIYHDAGQFYCYNIEKFMKFDGKIKDDILPFILNESEVQDIDNEEDWKLAEIKYQLLNKKNI